MISDKKYIIQKHVNMFFVISAPVVTMDSTNSTNMRMQLTVLSLGQMDQIHEFPYLGIQ